MIQLTGTHHFFVLNNLGLDFVKANNGTFLDYDMLYSLLFNKNDDTTNMRACFNHPINVICDDVEGRTNFNKTGLKCYSNKIQLKRAIDETLGSLNIETHLQSFRQVLTYYEMLETFVKNTCCKYVDFVDYVGQMARNQTSKTNSPDINVELSRKIDGYTNNQIYITCKEKLRDWYSEAVKKTFSTFINDEQNGNITAITINQLTQDDDEEVDEPFDDGPQNIDEQHENLDAKEDGEVTCNTTGEKKKYDVADIYPAYKLALMVFFLFSAYPEFLKSENVDQRTIDKKTENEYRKKFKKMICSYIVYSHLINTMCGVFMEKEWNDNIGNEYVYRILPNIATDKKY